MATILRSRGTFSATGMGTPALVTHYWDSAGGTGTALATEAVARVRAMWNAMAAVITLSATWTPNLVVDEIDEVTGDLVNQYAAAAPAAVTFSASGDTLPYFTQGLMRFATASFIAGRRLQGRSFIPGVVETDNQGAPGVPSAATLTALQGGANLLGTTIVTPMSQRIWHRPSPSAAGLSSPVISRTVSPTWAVLKSRRN